MSSHDERALHSLGAEAKEVHQVVLGYAVVTGAGHRAGADLHFHGSITGLGEGVHDEDSAGGERVDRAELFACPVVLEIAAGLEDFPESIIVAASVAID